MKKLIRILLTVLWAWLGFILSWGLVMEYNDAYRLAAFESTPFVLFLLTCYFGMGIFILIGIWKADTNE